MTEVIVTSADREAFIAYSEKIGRLRADLYGDAIRRGEWDHDDGIQAFARHRTLTPAQAAGPVLLEALTPSGDTKAVYMGEFSFNLRRVDEFGDEYNEKVYVPWDTIKQIMAAIRNRAAITQAEGPQS